MAAMILIACQTAFAQETKTQSTLKKVDKQVSSENNKRIASTKKIDSFIPLGTFKAWEAFSMISKQETVCWVTAKSLQYQSKLQKTSDGKIKEDNKNHPSALMVSIRLEKKERDELAYHSIEDIDEDKPLKIVIDGIVPFNLTPQEEWAWLASSIDESRFILTAKKGLKVKITGKNIHNKAINETYSLLGFTDAYNLAFQTCKEAFDKKH